MVVVVHFLLVMEWILKRAAYDSGCGYSGWITADSQTWTLQTTLHFWTTHGRNEEATSRIERRPRLLDYTLMHTKLDAWQQETRESHEASQLHVEIMYNKFMHSVHPGQCNYTGNY
jgi:hypothetical protein